MSVVGRGEGGQVIYNLMTKTQSLSRLVSFISVLTFLRACLLSSPPPPAPTCLGEMGSLDGAAAEEG